MENLVMNRRGRRSGTAKLGETAGACIILLLAACGKLEIGSFGDPGPSGDSAASGGTSGTPAGSASGGSPAGGSAAGDARERAAVDGFFDPPSDSAFLLPSGTIREQSWHYTFDAPPVDWADPSFDTSSFSTGFTGFYFGSPTTHDEGRTLWPEPFAELWARATFTVASAEEIPELVFWGRWDDRLKIYVNGELAASEAATADGYRYLGFRDAARAALQVGDNTVAVHVVDDGDRKYFDLGVVRSAQLTARPRSGFERTPALAVYGDIVERFMIEHGIPAGALAVMKRDEVVVSRGFGWSDRAMTTPIAEDAVLRIHVLDAMITRAAIRTLIDEDESLTEDTLVFPLLAQHGLTPAGGHVENDAVNRITLRHLIWHEDGLPPLPSPQQFYQDLEISADEVTIEDAVRWLYAKGPDIEPGACAAPEACGPVSDVVSRYVIHTLRGDLLTYLRDVVLAPVGTSDIFLAHERLAGRSPRGPGYFTLESPYDRWIYLEGQTSLAATAPALVRFSRGYHLYFGTPLVDSVTETWASPLDNGGHGFLGMTPGTFSVLVQRRYDEVSIAVIFNIGGNYGHLADELERTTDTLTATLSNAEWGL